MIQDIYPHIYHNEYTPHEPTPEDIVLHYKDNTVFVKKEEQNISFLKFSEVVSVYPKAKETFIYLFSIDKVSYYLIPELPEALFSNYHFENNRLFRTARPKDLAPLPESPDGSYLHGTMNTNSVENAVLQ